MTTGPLTFTEQDVDVTTRTTYGEARGEPLGCQRGVIWTIRTRATWDEVLSPGHPEREWWGTSPAKVCEHPWQYSSWNRNDPNYAKLLDLPRSDREYVALRTLVLNVFSGGIADPSRGCTTYKRTGTAASWDKAVDTTPPIVLGHQSFWRLSPNGKVLPYV